MSQISFAEAEQASKKNLTRREIFLQDMDQVIPWKAFVKLIEPHYPVAGRGCKPYPLESMLRVHLMQNFFTLSDPAMEDALYDTPCLRSFAGLSLHDAIPDETTILNFRHLLEANDLAEDMLRKVNALLARKGLMLKRGSIGSSMVTTVRPAWSRSPRLHSHPHEPSRRCGCRPAGPGRTRSSPARASRRRPGRSWWTSR